MKFPQYNTLELRRDPSTQNRFLIFIVSVPPHCYIIIYDWLNECVDTKELRDDDTISHTTKITSTKKHNMAFDHLIAGFTGGGMLLLLCWYANEIVQTCRTFWAKLLRSKGPLDSFGQPNEIGRSYQAESCPALPIKNWIFFPSGKINIVLPLLKRRGMDV